MPNLYPKDYEKEVIESSDLQNNKGITGYKRGVSFDFEIGDFIRDGSNCLVECSGVESWESWCKNCLNTERYKYLAYSSDFGIELDEAFQADTHEMAEAILTREITEALLADPYGRTDYISDISFNWIHPDSVQITCTVHGIDDVTLDITSILTYKGG